MRDIKFRAKRLDNGEWVESMSVAKIEMLDGTTLYYIGAGLPADTYLDKDGNIIAVETLGECAFYACNPETVGRFTGLADENGTKIFEGDVVEPVLIYGTHKGFSWENQLVVFCGGAFCLKDSRGEITPMCNYAANVKFKVWGNIHDNPGLKPVLIR